MSNIKETTQETQNAVSSLKANGNLKWIAICVIVLAVLAGGYAAYKQFVVKPADEKAQAQMLTGIQLLQQAQQLANQSSQLASTPDSTLSSMLLSQGMIPEGTSADSVAILTKNFRQESVKGAKDAFNKALNGDGKFPGFIKMANGSGAAANIGTYLAGITYFHMGNYKEAIKRLEAFSTKGDEGVSATAIAALANAYAADGQLDAAVKNFKNAAAEADNETFTPLYLVEAGKILEAQNKKEEAHAIYEDVKAKYPAFGMTQQGMLSSQIDKYIERTK